LVGLGRDLRIWRRIKAGVMRAWRKFSDGKLYHPRGDGEGDRRLERHSAQPLGKECDRIRKENKLREKRKEVTLATPTS
jgi:hypothetical protein